jgi:hypothetical protein
MGAMPIPARLTLSPFAGTALMPSTGPSKAPPEGSDAMPFWRISGIRNP